MEKSKIRITDLPSKVVQENMQAYGRKHSYSLRSSRKYLRSVGMNIKRDGTIIR